MSPTETRPRPRWKHWLPVAAAAVLVAGAGAWWWSSLLPSTYSMVDMGYPDFGGGPGDPTGGHGAGHAGGVVADGGGTAAGSLTSIETLVAEPRPADVEVDLTAAQGQATLADGRVIRGYTLNGSTPGPTITAREGDMVEVRLHNADVADGVTLHWHGVDVPNAVDGVAGVTQDALPAGGTHTYRFVADQVGTYWYHSHQQSHPQVLGGLFGALVILPVAGVGDVLDVPALVHFYDGVRTINGAAGDVRVAAEPGTVARVRIVNTDAGPMPVWVAGAAFRLLAVDGTDVVDPPEVRDRAVYVTAGGRADLEVLVPSYGAVRVAMAGASLVLGDGEAPTATLPDGFVDSLTYGTPAPLGFDPADADRTFDYTIGRRFWLLDGRPGIWWTINGGIFPDVPMFMVEEGDVVVMRVANASGEVHPMHLHGHHAVVLSKNGVAATGSPWIVDSLNVEHGATYEIAFVADNPGIWMDHCHNLPHASEGLMTHLAYVGYVTPFLVGGDVGNHPE